MIYDKGVLEYVEASKLLREQGVECICQVLGKIETDAGLGVAKSTVDQWDSEGVIEYLGTTDDVRTAIDPANCVVLPSYREGTPRTLLESSSMGKPLVTTDVPGCRETVVDGYNGYLCEVKNGRALAASMKKVYELSEDEYRQMGENSRRLAEDKFDEKLVIKAYFDALGIT